MLEQEFLDLIQGIDDTLAEDINTFVEQYRAGLCWCLSQQELGMCRKGLIKDLLKELFDDNNKAYYLGGFTDEEMFDRHIVLHMFKETCLSFKLYKDF